MEDSRETLCCSAGAYVFERLDMLARQVQKESNFIRDPSAMSHLEPLTAAAAADSHGSHLGDRGGREETKRS